MKLTCQGLFRECLFREFLEWLSVNVIIFKNVLENIKCVQLFVEMGHAPNRAARQLRRQQTDAIGYIIPSNSAGFADPFFSEFVAGLGDEVSAHNHCLFVATAPPAGLNEESQYQRRMQDGKHRSRACPRYPR